MDVHFPYTNIPNMEGIETVKATPKRKKYRNESYLDICPLHFNIK